MPMFRKKPVVIEAMEHTGELDRITEILDWINRHSPDGRGSSYDGAIGHMIFIETLEGTMRADPGDWIIRGVKGEFYPCKPEIFEATYEAECGDYPAPCNHDPAHR